MIINFTDSQLWDESAGGAIVKVKQQLEERGTHVEIVGFTSASEKLYKQLT